MAKCPTCGQEAGEALFCPHDGTPLSHLGRAAAMPSVGDVVDGRYELVELLGKGGMAVVFRAASSALGHDVAMKVLFPRWAEDRTTVARFAREARAASQIDHPNVVRVYDFGYADPGFYFLTMELLGGAPLSEVGVPLKPARALRVLIEIADGMARAHELGVVHRDLKPENVMLRREDGRDRLTIVDFGLSKVDEGAAITGQGDVLGTPDFMAPEQWQGKVVNARADVYSFGILAYEMLSGELPYQGDNIIQILQQHLYAIALPLSDNPKASQLPKGFSELVMRCMAKDPLDRPPHMGRVLDTLLSIEERARAISAEPTRVGLGAPMATVIAIEGALLDRRELIEEIPRLERVRQGRLMELVPRVFGPSPGEDVDELQKQIATAEAALATAEEDLALAAASLEESLRAHRTREAELRARLLNANLELAVARNALPGEVTNPHATADTISVGRHPSWVPPADVSDDAERALAVLQHAERKLGAFMQAEDTSIEESERRVASALAEKQRAEGPLNALHTLLERDLRSAPDGARAFAEIAQLDEVLNGYRTRLEIMERARARGVDV